MSTIKKKVLCIGDSLSLPGHLNSYEDTWFYLLKKEFPDLDFISYFKRQLSTNVLVSMGGGENGMDKWPKGADCLEAYMPEIVILQLGIVDCAPRLLHNFDKIILKLIPLNHTSNYIKLIKKIRSRNITNTFVSASKFCENLENYIARALKINTQVVIVSISLPDQTFLQKNPKIMCNVNKYNLIIRQLGEKYNHVNITIPLNPKDYKFPVYEDGYHPNTNGHRIIFESLKEILQNINE